MIVTLQYDVYSIFRKKTFQLLCKSARNTVLGIIRTPFTDKHRFYGSGISMGGYAIYQLFMTFADRFAAGIVCCGGGMYWNAEHIKDIPLWIFHGIQDDVIFVEEAIRMTEKLRGFGGKVKLTLYDNCCHDSWTQAYATPELYEWLLSQSR